MRINAWDFRSGVRNSLCAMSRPSSKHYTHKPLLPSLPPSPDVLCTTSSAFNHCG